MVFTQLGTFTAQAFVSTNSKKAFDNLPGLSQSEMTVISGFQGKVGEFYTHLDEVDKGNKSAYQKVRNSSDQIKASLPKLQSVVEGYVAKLKQSGHWNDDLDAVLAKLVAKSNLSSKDKAGFLMSVRNMGGVRNILANIGNLSKKASADVETMTQEAQRKSSQSNKSSSIMRNQFAASSASAASLKCIAAQVAAGIVAGLGGGLFGIGINANKACQSAN